jgi:hypothetical protein
MQEKTVEDLKKEDPFKARIDKREAEKKGRVTTFFKAEESNPQSKFVLACQKANIKPTKRQASKWLRKTGAAYKSGRF